MVPSCSSVLPVLASAAMFMLAPCCYAQVLAASPAEPHNSLALLQQHVHMAREPEAGGDDLAVQGSPCNTTDCDAAGVVQKQEHNESVVDNNASQASVLPIDDQSPESQQHDSTEEASSNQSGASHVPASEQVLEATGQSNRDQEMFDQDVEEQMDSAGDKSSVWEDKVNVWENLVTDAEIQANETGKEQVCVSLPVFENVEWVDELINNFLHFTWPGTKLAIHLNALTEYSEEDITRWNQTSSRIVVNPERIRVHKFMGGLLYTYVMNAKFLESVFPGQCGYFVMQESNQMWLRGMMERAVYQEQYQQIEPYPCFGKSNPDIIDHPFFKVLTDGRVENMAWMAPEGFFLQMKHMLNFIDLLEDWARKDQVNVTEQVVNHKGAIEEVWLPTYIRNKAQGLPALPEGFEFRPINRRSGGMTPEQMVEFRETRKREYSVKRVDRNTSNPGTQFVLALAA